MKQLLFTALAALPSIVVCSCHERVEDASLRITTTDGAVHVFSPKDSYADFHRFAQELCQEGDSRWNQTFVYHGRVYKLGLAFAAGQDAAPAEDAGSCPQLFCQVTKGQDPAALTAQIRELGTKKTTILYRVQNGVTIAEFGAWLDAIPKDVEIPGLGLALLPE